MVTLVTRLVNSLTFPITFEEKVCTPVTTDAAKSAPGRAVELLPGEDTEVPAGVEPPAYGRGS